MTMSARYVCGMLCCAALWMPARASAQIPVPSGPVTFCGTQAPPAADSYTVSVDGAPPVALTMSATVDARCPTGSTHSFTLAASLFPIGNHTVVVIAANAFGTTTGPSYAVTVGIAPGTFTLRAVLSPEL